jgi:PHD/YefM family antitoxin component YafN of YafNO toxin-antitoxin module
MGAPFNGTGRNSLKETKYMSEYQETNLQSTSGTPRWVGLAVAVLGGVSLLGLGVGVSALSHANSVETSTQASLKQQNDALAQRLAKDDEINQQLQSDLKVVTDKLNVTQADLIAARKQHKKAVVTYDKKLNAFGQEVNEKLAGKANAEDVTKLSGDVSGVRTDLDATNNTLQMAKSEMGTLIARNHDEIDQLRRMGQRDYFEFTVSRKGGAQHVGSVQVELKDTNTKKNQYTINVLADDKSFEKKNRSVNEPIFFYTGGTRQALELVVNKVTKTSASGYLSIPKSGASTAATNTGSGQ